MNVLIHFQRLNATRTALDDGEVVARTAPSSQLIIICRQCCCSAVGPFAAAPAYVRYESSANVCMHICMYNAKVWYDAISVHITYRSVGWVYSTYNARNTCVCMRCPYVFHIILTCFAILYSVLSRLRSTPNLV